MIQVAFHPQSRRRYAQLLAAVLGLWLTHRAAALLATRGVRPLARGYRDAELLAAGGDLSLELVLLHETALLAAIGSAGLWLLLGRLATWILSFFLYRSAFDVAWTPRASPRPRDRSALHTGWALPLVLGITLAETALSTSLLFGLASFGRWLRHANVESAAGYLLGAAIFAGMVWLLGATFCDLYRLALTGARQRPIAGAKSAGHTWRGGWIRLSAVRALLAVSTVAIALAGLLLLPAMTRGGATERLWGSLAIELGIAGALCLRAAWLTWASAHLGFGSAASLSSGSFEAAVPDEEPVAPADPSPSPDASPA